LPSAFGFFYAKIGNITNIGLNIHSDMLCDISRKVSAKNFLSASSSRSSRRSSMTSRRRSIMN
jgi:hypothetical protein